MSSLLQLTDILAAVADSSPGWSHNLLGAIGLGQAGQAVSHRGRFLARALVMYLRCLVTADGSGLVEKILEEEAMEGGQTQRRAVMELAEVRQQMDRLNGMKNNKAFLGLHDLVDWAVEQVTDETNTLEDAHNFLDYLTVNKLYVELYVRA